jgi:hypothetical protein
MKNGSAACSAILALITLSSPAPAQNRPVQVAAQIARPTPVQAQALPQAARLAVPPPEAMVILIRSSVVALSHANLTNNYSVLTGLGSQTFRAANSPARLAQIFAPFRSNNIDMNPVVDFKPQLTQQPAIENGRLRLIGYFPTQPMQVNFDLTFEPNDGVWKLFGLSVNLNQSKPAPPAPGAPAGR